MSDVRSAVLRRAEAFSGSRWLQLETSDGRPLPFRGGQYVIIDTGLKLADGRARKRAYSMLSVDSDAQRFELGVCRLPGGEAAEYLWSLPLGATIRFSGPWGKLHVPEALPEQPGPVWVIATDSGASAALGLVRSQAFAPLTERAALWHFRSERDAFLRDDFVRERVPAGMRFESAPLAAVHAPLRAAELTHFLTQRLHAEPRPAQVYLCGDGALARLATQQLMAAGVPEGLIQSESFFNHAEKKTARIQPSP